MNKRKVLIGIIVILSIVVLSCGFILLFDKISVKIANKELGQILEDEEAEEIIENTVENEETQEENRVNEIAEETAKGQENAVTSQQKETTSTQVQTSQRTTGNSNVGGSKQAQTSSGTKAASTTTTTTSTQTPKQETVVTNTPNVQVNTQTTGDKEVRNDTMINKIRQTIQNNETADMKNYGYQIIVDSSIKNLTNQFTFSESRIINFIRFKFGTIKIYAEDWYKNGQYTMTACYIL